MSDEPSISVRVPGTEMETGIIAPAFTFGASAIAALARQLTDERALADDLAADLELFNSKAPALARYREARR